MKRLLRFVSQTFAGDPFVLTTVAFLIFLIIVFPAVELLSRFFSIEITRFIFANCFLLLISITGVVIMVRKEYSMFVFVVTGKPAIIIGLLLTIVGIGGIILGLISNYELFIW